VLPVTDRRVRELEAALERILAATGTSTEAHHIARAALFTDPGPGAQAFVERYGLDAMGVRDPDRHNEGSSEFEPIAKAMAEWSSEKPWKERHPKNQRHWLFVAEIVMDDPRISDLVNKRVRVKKAALEGERTDRQEGGGVIRTSWFTFGSGQAHHVAGFTFDPDIVVKITAADPRAVMLRWFGSKWSMEYDEEPDMSYFRRGIVEITPSGRLLHA
jgi:hypothetical protein